MIQSVSENRLLDPSEIDAVAAEYANSWLDPEIPARQYDPVVKRELEAFRNHESVAPYDALVKCFRRIPPATMWMNPLPRVLDVGASSGYYREVLRIAGIHVRYVAIDFSHAFRVFAKSLYPDIHYDVGDARELPYKNNNFDIVMSGGLLMHTREYEQAIKEAARVASQYVIFHRCPMSAGETQCWTQEAYGVRCISWRFGEYELMTLFQDYGLELVTALDVFRDGDYAHRNFLLRKT